MPIEIRRLRQGDEQTAIDAVVNLKSEKERRGFQPGAHHMHEFLSRDENYLIVAFDKDLPVGFLVAYCMPMVARDGFMVCLYEIGVAPPYQRRGIGTKLINLLKFLCREKNVIEIWIETSNDNVAAKRLYTSTGSVLDKNNNAEFVYSLVP